METSEVLTIECVDQESANAVRAELVQYLGDSLRVAHRQNLTGGPDTWIIVAGAAITQLPKILDGIAKIIETLKVRVVRVGGVVIRNPSAADMRDLRKRGGRLDLLPIGGAQDF